MTQTLTARPAGSSIPARGLSRTDRARRQVDDARSYRWTLRLADNLHGFVDARRTEAPLVELPWVMRLQATYVENCHRILAGTRDVLASSVQDHEVARRELEALLTQLAEAEERMAGVRASDRGKGRGEAHLPDQAVADRAERAAESVRARLRGEIAELHRRRDQAQARIAHASALVEEEFGMTVELALRMHAFYQRRLHTYARRFVAHREDLAGLDHVLTLPTWAGAPCPWLPSRPAADPRLHIVR